MTQDQPNPLLSAHKGSSSGLQIQLHPLVLITISDYATRHILSRRQSPVVGALLGQQNGREVSLEVAFEAKVLVQEEKDDREFVLDEEWFEGRLQQFRDVYKDPPLDLVGWFSLAPTSGPQPYHLSVHRQLLQKYNESAVFLTVHPSLIAEGAITGGKLPITIYESIYEGNEQGVSGSADGDGDNAMQEQGEATQLKLRLRELPYSIETGEAEMIAMDFVARGGGNATAVEDISSSPLVSEKSTEARSANGKGKGKAKDVNGKEKTKVLSPEDEELIAALTAKSNAVRMLHSRVRLLRTYLTNLPPSYLNPSTPQSSSASEHTEIDHTVLRSIQSLVNRFPLLIPADHAAFEQEKLSESNDVTLVNLLGALTNSIKDAKEVGKKFDIVEKARQQMRQLTTGPGAIGSTGDRSETGYGGYTDPEGGLEYYQDHPSFAFNAGGFLDGSSG